MKIIESNPIDRPIRLAIVVSQFNEAVTGLLLEGAQARLAEHLLDSSQLTLVKVPGAIEIPLAARKLAEKNDMDAIVCLGAVIRGETSHYDYVCAHVNRGCAVVSEDFGLPVVFGVLTTENQAQALARCGGDHGHMGQSSIDTALAMISVLDQIGT